jgi:hypothetical protein
MDIVIDTSAAILITRELVTNAEFGVSPDH